VLATVVRRASAQVTVGIVLGAAGAAAVGRMLESALTYVRSGDSVTTVGVLAFLLVIAAVGCVVPARRAARLDPVAALRVE